MVSPQTITAIGDVCYLERVEDAPEHLIEGGRRAVGRAASAASMAARYQHVTGAIRAEVASQAGSLIWAPQARRP